MSDKKQIEKERDALLAVMNFLKGVQATNPQSHALDNMPALYSLNDRLGILIDEASA